MGATERKKNVIPLSGRIDYNTAGEYEKLLKASVQPEDTVQNILDMDQLEYISSFGLRLILSIAKKTKHLSIINASDAVYEVFEITGFTSLLNIRRKPREIRIDDLDFIAAGAEGEVFRLNNECIVKLCYEGIPQDVIEGELENSRQAFLEGVPTAISFEAVRCGSRFGMIYELVNAKTLGQTIRDDIEHLDHWLDVYVKLLRDNARIKVSSDVFPATKDLWREWLERLSRMEVEGKPLLSKERKKLAADIIDFLPDGDSFNQNDCTPANIMFQNGEIVLIDMGDAGRGHTLLELAMVLVPLIKISTKEKYEKLTSIPFEKKQYVIETFYRKYFDYLSEAELTEMSTGMTILFQLRSALAVGRGIGGGGNPPLPQMIDDSFTAFETLPWEEIRRRLERVFELFRL